MSIKYVIGNTCKKAYDKMKDNSFVNMFKMREQDFTRNRKAGFSDNMLMIFNKTGQGIRAAVKAFMQTAKEVDETYSQQAFSKGRMRIKWEAFREIYKITVQDCYQEYKYKTYKGYRVSAIDGTRFNLPYHEDSIKEFGVQKSTNNQIQALASCMCDVLNGIIIDGIIAPCNSNERELAAEHLNNIEKIKEPDLIIFDRGYPSAKLIDELEKSKAKYLMRCDKTFVKGMLKHLTGNDCVITHTFKNNKITKTIRVIRFKLNGNTETLITNIYDNDFSVTDFVELYHLRWGIETKYNDLKNKLEIENFSGTTPLAIRQDFFATLFLSNLASLMILECEDEISKRNAESNNKYDYKANVNAVIAELRKNVVLMLITDSNRQKKKLMKGIYNSIVNAVLPIRDNRSFERVKKHHSNKYHQNDRA